MTDSSKTVFISYRRNISKYIARLVFNALETMSYDVFIDIESIDSGKFDKIILNQIAARAHFVLILAPGSLDRVNDKDDWLRIEIEHAIKLERNIVPIFVDGFKFGNIVLPESISTLPKFNGMVLHNDYFTEGINRLTGRFLKQPVYGPILPAPKDEQLLVDRKIQQAKLYDVEEGRKQIDSLKEPSQKKFRFWLAPVIILFIACASSFLYISINSEYFRGFVPDYLYSNATVTNQPSPTSTSTPTFTTSPTNTLVSSNTSIPLNPVIDTIGLAETIICDGRRYEVPIYFHDADGNSNNIRWELLYSEKNTPFSTTPRNFNISSSLQMRGAIFEDWIEWDAPGDRVKIRVTITDSLGLFGWKDFEFTCSN